MKKYNTTKLSQAIRDSGITTHGNCNSNGIVWDDDNKEIQNRPDVKAIIANLDNLPDPPVEKTDAEKLVELRREFELLKTKVDTKADKK